VDKKERERKYMNIEDIVQRINNGETRKDVGESLGMSNTTLSRRLKDAGYVYNNSTKKYDLASPKTESQEENNQEIKEINNKESNSTNKQEKQQIKKPKEQKTTKQEIHKIRKPKKVTYEIDEDLHFELRMMAFKRKINVSELVEAAIRQYLRG
jgi:hypothetical protein